MSRRIDVDKTIEGVKAATGLLTVLSDIWLYFFPKKPEGSAKIPFSPETEVQNVEKPLDSGVPGRVNDVKTNPGNGSNG